MIQPTVSNSNSRIRILLVEDNDISRQLMTDYLGHCGYCVRSLAIGATFAQEMNQFQPHLVLLDLKLPDIDGFALLEQVQKTATWSNIPVVVVSAFAFQADRRRALGLGARKYLVKPVRLPQVQEAITDVLNLQ